MFDEVQDMKKRIHRLEDNLLRCKNFQEQVRMSNVLLGYRKHLQTIIWKQRDVFY